MVGIVVAVAGAVASCFLFTVKPAGCSSCLPAGYAGHAGHAEHVQNVRQPSLNLHGL